MKAIIQKVKKCVLYSNNEKFSQINDEILVLFGVHKDDKIENVSKFSEKLLKLRIFEDENHKINKNIFDTKREIMVVSNFTIYGNLKGTNRPDFINSAKADKAEIIYNAFCDELRKQIEIKTGVFQTYMEIETILDGPNTYILELD